jgi:hypothetical protein
MPQSYQFFFDLCMLTGRRQHLQNKHDYSAISLSLSLSLSYRKRTDSREFKKPISHEFISLLPAAHN